MNVVGPPLDGLGIDVEAAAFGPAFGVPPGRSSPVLWRVARAGVPDAALGSTAHRRSGDGRTTLLGPQSRTHPSRGKGST